MPAQRALKEGERTDSDCWYEGTGTDRVLLLFPAYCIVVSIVGRHATILADTAECTMPFLNECKDSKYISLFDITLWMAG